MSRTASTASVRPAALYVRSAPFAYAFPIAALTWGALAFGAVYPWAYWPLAGACLLCGLVGLIVNRGAHASAASGGLVGGLCAVGAAVLVQVIPLPASALAALSPRTVEVLRDLNPAFAAGLMPQHPLSVWPRDTWTALALYSALAVLLVGMTRLFSLMGGRRFVELLTALGVVLALAGIVQKPLYAGAIYGLWDLEPGRTPFGPFVNRNHFAGWMLMALPLALALLSAGIDRGMRGLRPGWRYKVLWFSSPEASRLILLAGATVVMALSLMLTMSRSGIAAFLVAVGLTGWSIGRGLDRRSSRWIAAGALVLLIVTVVVWTGPAALASRFSAADWGELNTRRGAWADAWSVARDFPLAGTGLNTYWAAALFYQRHDLAHFFAQAHNDYLQLAAEGGLLLIVPALVCVTIFVRDVRRARREPRGSTTWWLRAGAVTSLVAIALQEAVEFSLQMPGNAALFTILCALALHRPASAASQPRGDAEPQPALQLVSSAPARRQHAETGTRLT